MRPRVLTRGNWWDALLAGEANIGASMRPRVLTRGNRLGEQGRPTDLAGFNEASRSHARKRPKPAWSGTPTGKASMRPRVLTRGNH